MDSVPAELDIESRTTDALPAERPASHLSPLLSPPAGSSCAVSVELASDRVLPMSVPAADPPVQLMSDGPSPTSSTYFVAVYLPVPVRQRNTKAGRGRSKLTSFVSTSDDHMSSVQDKENLQNEKKLRQEKRKKKLESATMKSTENKNRKCDSKYMTSCMYCEIRHCNSSVEWVKCKSCKQWSCLDCAHLGRKNKAFTCDNCK